MVHRNNRKEYWNDTLLEYKYPDGTKGWIVRVRTEDERRKQQEEKGKSGA